MKLRMKAGWKFWMVFTVLCGILVIVISLSVVTYGYFSSKIVNINEHTTQVVFRESERKLKNMMEKVEYQLIHFANNENLYDYLGNEFSINARKSIVIKDIVKVMDEMLLMNDDISAIAFLSGDGRTIVSAKDMSQTGLLEISESTETVLGESKESYPYINWISSCSLEGLDDVFRDKVLSDTALIGIKALGEGDSLYDDGYLLVSLKERNVEKSYDPASYDKSYAVLADKTGKIISAVDQTLIGETFVPSSQNYNIRYDLKYHGWFLVNMIPKEVVLKEVREIRNFGIFLTLAAVGGIIIFCMAWSRKYTHPIQHLITQMEKVGDGQLDISKPEHFGVAELDMLNMEFYSTVQKLQKYITRLQEVEKEKRREELRALQYQINPHFLCNSINAIRWMALMTNSSKVADALGILSKIFTPILRNPSMTWKLKDELEFLENYVSMMMIRYGSVADYHQKCPESLYEEEFPRFILQPIIENCFVHGNKSDVQDICVEIAKMERFRITVRNTGASIGATELERINRTIADAEDSGKIGLPNVQKRLQFMFGEEGKLWIESNDDVTVIITF